MSEHNSLPSPVSIETIKQEAINLLKKLIAIPSFSREENLSADLIAAYLQQNEIAVWRSGNNVWAKNKYYNAQLPTILLNSHHDTVKPNAGYTLNPFEPMEKDGKLFGLGSNDAGGALVSLLATFLFFYEQQNLQYNFIFSATAEEEISGLHGVSSILDELGEIDFAIVGEPTEMNIAIAEKGLMVVDCVAKGTAAHVAHDNPNNAIVNALKDITWLSTFSFPKVSETLGKIKMNVTMIQSGIQHNIVPDRCEFTVDIRTTDVYSNQEVLDIIQQHISSNVSPRSLRLNPSSIPVHHPFVQAGIALGKLAYGSPTTSDMALMNFPSVKIGPGNSLRSHSSNEFIFIDEINEGIELYIKMLSKIV
ncbi:MAG: M20 family metallo-hydrolase [Bacteroidota bacterium]